MTDEEIKAKYGKVYKIEIDLDDELVIGYLKKPDLKTYSAAISTSAKDELEGGRVFLANSIIPEISDKRILEDTECFLAALKLLPELLQTAKASLKKI